MPRLHLNNPAGHPHHSFYSERFSSEKGTSPGSTYSMLHVLCRPVLFYNTIGHKLFQLYIQESFGLTHSAFNHVTHYKSVTRTGENHHTTQLFQKHHTWLVSSTLRTRLKFTVITKQLYSHVTLLAQEKAYTWYTIFQYSSFIQHSLKKLYNTKFSYAIQLSKKLCVCVCAFTNF